MFYRRKLGEESKHSSTHTSKLLGNPAVCRGHKSDGGSPVKSRSIIPQGGEAVALPFDRPRGSNLVVDITWLTLVCFSQLRNRLPLSVFWTYFPRFLVHLASLHLSLNGGILCLSLISDGIFPYTGEVFRLGGGLCCPIKSKRS